LSRFIAFLLSVAIPDPSRSFYQFVKDILYCSNDRRYSICGDSPDKLLNAMKEKWFEMPLNTISESEP
jgi:hypothetical protein